jgi:antagonist of KipI
MGIEIIKAGISDSLQDLGRFGFQHLGINPTGVMDATSMAVANAVTGNALHEAVLEFAFPAPVLKFQNDALIAFSGADFTAVLNEVPIPLNQPIQITAQSVIKFLRVRKGRWCYLSVRGGFAVPEWLKSKSTHLVAGVGGFNGRKIKKGDVLSLQQSLSVEATHVLPWRSAVATPAPATIRCLAGAEFSWLTKTSQTSFATKRWRVTHRSDRMGYALQGPAIKQAVKRDLVSTAVTAGTLQLLPSGEVLTLMADHQTTGGYPRIAHVISADRPALAQKNNEPFSFCLLSIEEAEAAYLAQARELQQLSISCQLKLQNCLL